MSATVPCYQKSNGSLFVQYGGFAPCGPDPPGGAATCCRAGHVCLSDGFCAYFDGTNGYGSKSGYYLGGCTDPNYMKPGCRTECEENTYNDVVWDVTGGANNTWSCCGTVNGSVQCYPPRGPNFSGPDAPNPLLLVPSASMDLSGTPTPWGPGSTSAVAQSVTVTAMPSQLPSVLDSARTSPAVNASAIILGVILAVTWLSIGVVYLHLIKKRRLGMSSDSSAPGAVSKLQTQQPRFNKEPAMLSEYNQQTDQPYALHGRELPYQLDGNERVELSSSSQG